MYAILHFCLKLIPKEPFDREILRAVVATEAAAFMSVSMLARIFLDRMMFDQAGKYGLLSAIRRTVELVIDGNGDQTEERRLRYMYDLCVMAAAHLDVTKALSYLRSGSEFNHRANENEDDQLALTAAVYAENVSMLRVLRDKGVDINTGSTVFGKPLEIAAKRGHEDIVKMLLEQGANVNDGPDRDGTVLQAASFAGHEKVIRLLLEPKYNLNTSGTAYEDAILKAARVGHKDLVQLLIERGKFTDLQRLQYKIFWKASAYGRENLVRMMLEEGLDVNFLDYTHETALHKAAT